MISRGCRLNLWRSRLPSVVTSHRVRSQFSAVPHLASIPSRPIPFSTPLTAFEKAPDSGANPIGILKDSSPSRTLEGTPGSRAGQTENPKSNFIGFKDFGSSPHLRISEEVKAALAANRPVVALESTIYTHGLPFPDNAQLAVHLEQILRDMGVVPATIGLVDGVAVIGLNPHELLTLASAAGQSSTMKVSRRDLPYMIGMGLAGRKIHGGTTVAATMYLAEMCGIKVFATGGIGGVHRGGQDTMDVSADLTELGRTSMAVVASGCKSFLDIPRTLEFLETQGVTVATFSNKEKSSIPFPAFYTTDSGVKSPLVVGTPKEAAAIIYAQELLGPSFTSGFLLANPIPEDFAFPKADIDTAIEAAVQEAAAQGIHGHANTPFILARIKDLTKGKSVVANKALIESNVQVGGRVAQALSDLKGIQSSDDKNQTPSPGPIVSPLLAKPQSIKPISEVVTHSGQVESPQAQNIDVMVFGSLAVDLSCDFTPENGPSNNVSHATSISPTLHTSNIAKINASLGGVGHNVALAAHLAGGGKVVVRLCSYVADDFAGTTALNALEKEGLDTRGVRVKSAIEERADGTKVNNHTAQYVAVNDSNKDLVVAMADMSLFTNRGYKIESNQNHWDQISAAKWTVVDANWDPRVIHIISRAASRRGSKVAFEPVSIHKSSRLLNIRFQDVVPNTIFPWNLVDLASPNQHELAAMHMEAKTQGLMEKDEWWKVIDAMGIPSSGARDRFVQLTNAKMADTGIPVQSIQLLPFIPIILTKLGAEGVLHTELLKPDDLRLTDPNEAPYILSRCANGTTEVGGVYMRLFPAAEVVEDVVSVNGVGDTFLGVLVAGLASGRKLDEELIHAAQKGAVMTLRSSQAVSPEIKGLISTSMQDRALAKDAEDLLGLLDM